MVRNFGSTGDSCIPAHHGLFKLGVVMCFLTAAAVECRVKRTEAIVPIDKTAADISKNHFSSKPFFRRPVFIIQTKNRYPVTSAAQVFFLYL